jgi:hypothetical protein
MLPENATSSEIENFFQEQKRMIKVLQDQRVAIQNEYNDQMQRLLARRNEALTQNATNLIKLGIKEQDITTLPTDVIIERKCSNRLSHNQMRQSLEDFMKLGEGYPSPILTEQLGVSYPVFLKFLQQNTDFIEAVGKNKGRVYKRRPVQYPQDQE